MKRKELKRLLIQKAEHTAVKDMSSEIIRSVLSLENKAPDVREIETPQSKRPAFRAFYPLLAGAFALLVICISAGAFVFSGYKERLPVIHEKIAKSLSNEVLALGNVVSGINGNGGDSASGINGGVFRMAQKGKDGGYGIVMTDNREADCDKNKKIAAEINKYLFTASAFLDSDKVKCDFIKNPDKSSGYAYKLAVSFKDMKDCEGGPYEVYCNIEKKSVYRLRGEIHIYEKSYDLIGESKIDGNGAAGWLKVYLNDKDESSIMISNETADNGNGYRYTFYKNYDEIAESVRIRTKVKSGETKAELEIFAGGVTGDKKTEESAHCEFIYGKESIDCTCTLKGSRFGEECRIEGVIIYIFDDYYLYAFGRDCPPVKLDKIRRR